MYAIILTMWLSGGNMPMQCERLAQLTYAASIYPTSELYLMLTNDAVSDEAKRMIRAALRVSIRVENPVAASQIAKSLCLGRKHKKSELDDVNLHFKWLDS